MRQCSVVYSLVLFVLFALTAISTIFMLFRYLEEPTYIRTKIVEQMDSELPAMTVCDSSNDTITHPVFTHYMRYIYADAETGKQNKKWRTQSELGEIFVQRSEPHFQHCYTFWPTERERRQLGVYYISTYYHRKVQVYFHRIDQFSEALGPHIVRDERSESQIAFEDVRLMAKTPSKLWWRDDSTSCSDEGRKPCSFLSIHLGARNLVDRPKWRSLFYFGRRVTVHEERPLYDFVEFVGESGGCMQLFVGVSAVDIVNRVIAWIFRNYT